MSTDNFKRFETDGSGQKMMPLLITDQILVKSIESPAGAALLLRSTPNNQTGSPVETQWYITTGQVEWLIQHLRQVLKDANSRERSR